MRVYYTSRDGNIVYDPETVKKLIKHVNPDAPKPSFLFPLGLRTVFVYDENEPHKDNSATSTIHCDRIYRNKKYLESN